MNTYYEDLSVGESHDVGDYTVTEEEIIEFARKFDPQPFHVDPEAAKESIFDGLIASGLHTLCLATRLTNTGFWHDVANMGGRGMDDIRWHHPVRPDDTISVTVEVEDKSPSDDPDRGYVDFGRSVYNQHGDEVMSFISYTIIRRRDVVPEG